MFSNYMMAAVALVALAALGQTKPPKGEWPLPGHDNRHLAQAELPCDMASAPQEVWSYDIGSVPAGAALCADVDGDGEDEVIYGASPLVCKKLSGEELWRSGLGRVIAIADIDGDGRAELLTDSAVVVDGRTGGVLWSRTGPGGVAGRLQVAKLLPDVKGLQIATVSTDYGTMSKHAQVWSFANGFEFIWNSSTLSSITDRRRHAMFLLPWTDSTMQLFRRSTALPSPSCRKARSGPGCRW